MASTDFSNGVTLTDASWFDDVDNTAYSVLTSIGGTANAITATGPVTYSYSATRTPVYFIPASTNTGATTINITPSGGAALGVRNIFWNGAACRGGELKIGVPCVLIDDGTRFHLVGPFQPGWEHISTGTAVSSAALDFTGLTGYGSYRFVLSNVAPTDGGVAFQVRASTNNGVSFQAGATDYVYANWVVNSGGGSGATASTSVSSMLLANSITTSLINGISGQFATPEMSSAKNHHCTWQLAFYDGTSFNNINGMGAYTSTQVAVNALRFMMSAGNVSTGQIKCYGLRNT
jgi:hypothetical protein